ncbi:DUF6332 family protein [Streptomyces sp. NBC_00576]|uniref:DUF6332 family protein n=1 Tax=Streptomyces sp. NBC_00576 TaxID=2903665 RepID=UPI002E803BCD|nr:DUF6332 family protein [Streptomyces sp. NBC_00576]WUB76395.1 DUF6332 family protein [Streptomyces sp. NBC_00576]
MDNHGGHIGQGRARDSQARRDAVTVEIGYALCSALFLAAVVFGVVAGPALVFALSDAVQGTLVASGATLGAILFTVRVVSVLNRFARDNADAGGDQPSQPGRTNPDS